MSENAAMFRDLAAGRGDDARKALALVNAAHAVQLAGLAATLSDACALAAETLASGRVIELLDRYCELSNDATS